VQVDVGLRHRVPLRAFNYGVDRHVARHRGLELLPSRRETFLARIRLTEPLERRCHRAGVDRRDTTIRRGVVAARASGVSRERRVGHYFPFAKLRGSSDIW
jgi:hypothetical protein